MATRSRISGRFVERVFSTHLPFSIERGSPSVDSASAERYALCPTEEDRYPGAITHLQRIDASWDNVRRRNLGSEQRRDTPRQPATLVKRPTLFGGRSPDAEHYEYDGQRDDRHAEG